MTRNISTAAWEGNLLLVKALLNQGVPVNPRNPFGLTPLHYAALAVMRRPRIVHALIQKGANPKYRNRQGKTPYNRSTQSSTRNAFSTRNALKTSRAATKWLQFTKKRKLERQKVASLVAMSPLPLNIKRRILSNAGLKKKSPVKK